MRLPEASDVERTPNEIAHEFRILYHILDPIAIDVSKYCAEYRDGGALRI